MNHRLRLAIVFAAAGGLTTCSLDFPEKDRGGEYACTGDEGCIEGYQCIDDICQKEGFSPGDVLRPGGGDVQLPSGDDNSGGDMIFGDTPMAGDSAVPMGDAQQGGDSQPGPMRIVGAVVGPSLQTSSSTSYQVRGMFYPYLGTATNDFTQIRGSIKSTSYTIVPPIE